MSIRSDLEALLAKAQKASDAALAKMSSASGEEYTAAVLKWQALHEVVGDLDRTLMHFKRPATAAALEGQ